MTAFDKDQLLRRVVIAIDGPSGSGKTTTAREVARRLALRHLDTGAMYRCVALAVIRAGVDAADADTVSNIAESVRIRFSETTSETQAVTLDGEDVTSEIRSPEVTAQVSLVSSHANVRRAMVRRQRQLADKGGVVLEGRDIGSVVLPSADVKIYLDASAEVRAERRYHELRRRGVSKSLEEVQHDLEERDRLDSTRAISPLKIPVGARVVDTSGLSIEQQVERAVRITERAAERIAGLVSAKGEPNRFGRMRPIWHAARLLILLVLRAGWGLRVLRKDDADYCENFIYASNHRSNADPPIVGATVRREVYFLAKEALFTSKRGFVRLITTFNAIPLRRGTFDRAAMERCLGLLADGRSLAIFPEGGRQRGPALGRALPGVGYLALQSGRSVVPVYVDGTASMASSLLRRPRLVVRQGRAIRLDPADLERFRNAEGYRDFGDTVLAAIQALKDENERR